MLADKKSFLNTVVASLLFTISMHASAQEVVASAGENLQSNNLQINYTLGQLVNSTASTGSVIVTQGFHQSFAELVEALATPEEKIFIETYPNPTRDFLTIQSEDPDPITYTLYNLNGAKVAKGSFEKITKINVQGFAKGTYQLFLMNQKGQLIDSFKIQFK